MTAPLFDWANLTMDGFVAAGVRDVVLSPGSRSTAFVLAAARHPELHVVDVVDERSAGFFALGQARATGRPSLLLCTSGTAGAHYLPAVIEASAAGVPLVVMTADRPPERMDCGAPQVTDQSKLFGDHVRAYVELGLPDSAPRAMRGAAARCALAVSRARWPWPGPIHVNAAARKPLEPEPEQLAASATVGTASEATVLSEVTVSSRVTVPAVEEPLPKPSRAAIDRLARRLAEARRPLVVAGPGPLAQRGSRAAFRRLMAASHSPFFVEWTSQLRGDELRGLPLVDAGAALLGSPAFRERCRPDMVLQIGAAPVATGWEELVEGNLAAFHAVLSLHQYHDPVRSADLLLLGDLEEALAGLSESLSSRAVAVEDEWIEGLMMANAEARRAIDEMAVVGEGSALGEAQVARTVLEELPARGLFALGNSLPIRWAELFGPATAADCSVWCQRGVNGIDGLVSGAAGSTHALSRTPSARPSATVLLLGDLALHHDLGGLATLDLLREDGCATFVIVVINNHGGRLFELLPVADLGLEAAVESHWTTPHRRSFAGAAALFDLAYEAPKSVGELRSTLRSAMTRAQTTLIEVDVASDSARSERTRLRQRVEEAMAAIGRR